MTDWDTYTWANPHHTDLYATGNPHLSFYSYKLNYYISQDAKVVSLDRFLIFHTKFFYGAFSKFGNFLFADNFFSVGYPLRCCKNQDNCISLLLISSYCLFFILWSVSPLFFPTFYYLTLSGLRFYSPISQNFSQIFLSALAVAFSLCFQGPIEPYSSELEPLLYCKLLYMLIECRF